MPTQDRHVDTAIPNDILKKGTRGSFHQWTKDDYDLTVTMIQKSHVGLFVDSEIVLSTRYGKVRVFINKDLINRDRLLTRPYQQRPLINKV